MTQFKYCKKCVGIRQFKDGKCDVCGNEALSQGFNDRARKILQATKTGHPSDYQSTTPIDDAIERSYQRASVGHWWDIKNQVQRMKLMDRAGKPIKTAEDLEIIKYNFAKLPREWQQVISQVIYGLFYEGEKLDEILDRFYKQGEEQSEAPDQPFTLRRYIKDKSYSQLPTEIRGNTINLAQQGVEAKQPIGLRSMGKYKYVESGKFSKHKERKTEHICEKLKNTVWEMTDPRRPILPSENVGITNTHPHCKCIWETWTEVETEPSYVGHTLRPTLNGRPLSEFGWKKTGIDHVGKVDQIIQDKYKNRTLQKIDKEGNLIGTMESRAEEKNYNPNHNKKKKFTCLNCQGDGCDVCDYKGYHRQGKSEEGEFTEKIKRQIIQLKAEKKELLQRMLVYATSDPEYFEPTMKKIEKEVERIDAKIRSLGGDLFPGLGEGTDEDDAELARDKMKDEKDSKEPLDWQHGGESGAKCPNCQSRNTGQKWEFSDGRRGHNKDAYFCYNCGHIFNEYREYYREQLENVRTCNCPAKTVGLMMGEVAAESWEANGQGKKVKGILAYSGISHNKRLYLPEVLSKGDGKTVPLIFNHATTAGIEQELHTLPADIQRKIQNEERIQVGEVKLHWKPEDLTMFYEGVVTHPFFINEVENDKMTVSLGMIFDADSPQVCDVECYTVVKGGEFNEVSLVYHPGFPIASIEANEAYLKAQIREYGHTIYEGIEQGDMQSIWESMSDLQKVTLVKIADLEEKYPDATSHEFNDFSGECVEQLVRAYNGEQSTVEPTNIADQNTNIVKDNELSMEYKNISNELDKMIDGRKTPTQKALEAINVLIEAQTATQKVPDILGVFPLEDAIKDVTIIKWDNRNHVLPNRKTGILITLKNRRGITDEINSETPFADLPKVIKDDLKQLGFEVRLDLPKGLK